MPINSTNWSSFQKLVTTVLPKNAAVRMRTLYEHWESSKGTVWLVNRQKAILDITKLLLSGRQNEARKVAMLSSISVDDRSIPKGVEGIAVRSILETRSGSVARRSFAVLRAYSGLKLTEASAAQLDKARKTITSPPLSVVPHEVCEDYWDYKEGEVVPGFWFCHRPLQLGKLHELSGTSSYPHLLEKRAVGKRAPYASAVASLASKGALPASLIDYYGTDSLMRLGADKFQMDAGDDTYGNIVVIQEGGAKGRVVCSPNAWVQYHMHPLHKFLSGIIKREEASTEVFYGLSCVTDQLRGVYHTRKVIEKGQYAASVDLSAATDRFPLWVQTSILRYIGLGPFAEAFEQLKGPYWFPDGTKVFYETGQPMGVYGSFPLFHLTHLFVLRRLCRDLGLPSDQTHFCVLGDDVVIYNEALHARYRDQMAVFGVEISEHKSYEGNFVEFAGFVVYKRHGSTHSFRPYKWGEKLSFSSIMNTMHSFGSATTKWGSWWANRYGLFQVTQGMRSLDLSPLVPCEDKLAGVNQVVSEEYLMGIYESMSRFGIPDTLSTPLVFEPGEESWPHSGQTTAGYRLGTFDPASYWKKEILRKRSDVLRMGYESDRLIKQAFREATLPPLE